jgi:N-acetylglutamate synthase-like GNAT family acetyltransferase
MRLIYEKGTAMPEKPPSGRKASSWHEGVTIRTNLKPGDIGSIISLHGILYAREYGFDPTFEAYVAGPLSEFVRSAAARERLWLAERADQIIGCIAIVAASPQTAQLRWFLVDPAARGAGLGKRLLTEALTFCKECGYRKVILWTVSALAAAGHLYRLAGFRKVEEKPGRMWGVQVVEEKYELVLPAGELHEDRQGNP